MEGVNINQHSNALQHPKVMSWTSVAVIGLAGEETRNHDGKGQWYGSNEIVIQLAQQ